MRFRSCNAAIAAVLLLTAPLTVWAHGLGYRQSDLMPVSLEFSYSTGEAMSYREAMVYSPKDEKFAFQTGRTDEAGRFAFTPDVPGRWRVVVKDEEGHMAEAVADVTEDILKRGEFSDSHKLVQNTTSPQGADLLIRAGLSVSLLMNAALVAVLWRKKVKNSTTTG